MLQLSNFLWQKDKQHPHHFSTPFPCHPPWYLCASLLPLATSLGHSSYQVRHRGEAAVWREGGGVGSTLEAPLCKPGQPAAPVGTVGLALEHQEACLQGKSASPVLITDSTSWALPWAMETTTSVG